MSFSIRLTGTLNKTVSSTTQIAYVLEKLVTCTKEAIFTFVVPETATASDYVSVNLEPFIVQAGSTKMLYIETDKRICVKMNVATTPTSGDIIAFQGVNVDTYMLITGDVDNLYFNRLGDVDDANVTIRVWG